MTREDGHERPHSSFSEEDEPSWTDWKHYESSREDDEERPS
ncbi:hypothetical protein [Halorussus pelagicus]|nr:hypothetical protein [Halorussus pelagicus]